MDVDFFLGIDAGCFYGISHAIKMNILIFLSNLMFFTHKDDNDIWYMDKVLI